MAPFADRDYGHPGQKSFFEGYNMRTTIALILIAAVIFLVAGCGPGQPFEIEQTLHTPQPAVTTQLASAD